MSAIDSVAGIQSASWATPERLSGVRRMAHMNASTPSYAEKAPRGVDSGAGDNRVLWGDDIGKTVDTVNDTLQKESSSVRFKIDRQTDELQIQIVDSKNDKVLRSIPSDEMLRLAARMRELAGVGVMVDRSL